MEDEKKRKKKSHECTNGGRKEEKEEMPRMHEWRTKRRGRRNATNEDTNYNLFICL